MRSGEGFVDGFNLNCVIVFCKMLSVSPMARMAKPSPPIDQKRVNRDTIALNKQAPATHSTSEKALLIRAFR
jgi:hypothetical protein